MEITLDGVTYVAKAKAATALGIPLADSLPDGWQPEGVIVLVRATDSEGQRRTTQLEGGDIMLWEAKGMLETAIGAYDARLEDCDPDEDSAAKEEHLMACQVVKSTPELRLTTGLAYPAFKTDVARARDGHIDFASKDVLRQCAHNYLRNPGVSLYHEKGTDGHAEVVESYVWPDGAPDWTVGDTIIKEGDWLVTCIWDEETWPLVKEGVLRGWSPEGGARRVKPSSERLALLRP